MLPSFSDLAAAWGAMVRANSEQVERFQESAPRSDFYAPMAASFKADPGRTDDPVLDHLRALVRPQDTWLDIGGGAGRIALPLALLARSVTVLDPSPAMLAILRESMDEYGIANVEPVEARWPAPGTYTADCALISHVGYDVEAIGPFVEAMEAAARRCVAVLLDRAPASAASPFWPEVHGEPRNELPAAREFVALLLALGRLPAISLYERPAMTYRDRDQALSNLRIQLWVAPGSAKDARLQAALDRMAIETPGGIQFAPAPGAVAVIEWSPR
jgi:SAM-dependent methyltransferase